ncbi:MAG: sulfatase [Fuerstiella sp.]|nr:sulfatase [Fuerstiella sp.]MCP4855349.1 sulfatase [Fuerstiella sp.]
MPFRMLIAVAMLCAAQPNGLAEKKPNIVMFLADDLGWTGLECFGSDLYETPHLDTLAKSGMMFTDAYAACTVCSPTRASIMTGMYPARLRCTDFIAGQNRPHARLRIPDWTKRLQTEYVTIAEALREAGYRTAHVGKWHLEGKGDNAKGTDAVSQGFDVSIEKPAGTRGYFLKKGTTSKAGTNYVTDWLTDEACDFIDDSRDDPFFLYFAYHVPHTPIQGRADLVEYFQQKVLSEATHNNPTYAAMVASLDQSVGRVLQNLKANDLTDNTVIVFTSDNGGLTQRYGKHDGFTENLPLRRGKGSAYEGGVRVPTIIRWPGVTKPGATCRTPIMTIDYYPTFLEVARAAGDADHNRSVDGLSLSSLLRDPAIELDRSLYWHYPHYHAGGDGPYSAIRSGDYRLIEFHEDKSLRLFDLAGDIGEQDDLAEQEPDKARALHSKLQHWRTSVAAQMPTRNQAYDAARESEVGRRR